ncbi:MAG: DUF6491 family protein [Rhodospirillaceae bacterium]|nr:DUF6491 family protein [Rhodospirillaceae bacterium]
MIHSNSTHLLNSWLTLCFVCAGALGACATQTASVASGEQSLTVEEILADAPRPEHYAGPVKCLHRDAYTNVEVINGEYLLFHGRRDKAWVNRLRNACTGLRRHDTLVFETYSGRVCDFDTVNGADSVGGTLQSTSARCGLGSFDPVTPEQAEQLRDLAAS